MRTSYAEHIGLGGIVAAINAFQAAALLTFPVLWAPRFATMFDVICGLPLSPITRLAVSPWFPVLAGAATLAGPLLAAIPAVPTRARRPLLAGAFVLGCTGIALCVIGVYLPIHDMAGTISMYAGPEPSSGASTVQAAPGADRAAPGADQAAPGAARAVPGSAQAASGTDQAAPGAAQAGR